MMGSHRLVGEALQHILQGFGWKVAALLFHNHAMASSRGNSRCHFTLGAVYTALNQSSMYKSFNQEATTAEDYRDLLAFVSKSARSKCTTCLSFHRAPLLLALEILPGIGCSSLTRAPFLTRSGCSSAPAPRQDFAVDDVRSLVSTLSALGMTLLS
jgi:hypothetical protein